MGVVRSNASQHKSNSTINLDETASKANHNSFKNNLKSLNLPIETDDISRRSSMHYDQSKALLRTSASANKMTGDEVITFLILI